MIRDVELDSISDGRKYEAGDLAKLGVGDCSGCHACCCGMGDTVVLDPYDVFSMEKGLSKKFEELQKDSIDLRVVDGIILPCLKMTGSACGENEACNFLNDEGRCSIHAFRPGFCRLFPLGRIYENETHKYFLQVDECQKERQAKIKIKKWIGTPNFAQYEKYVDTWHYFIKGISERTGEMGEDQLKAVNMGLLRTFYAMDYDVNADFYPQFYDRLARIGL
ncbi:YkgJ family cysteine cluster protein [Butyrivibrio sp. LC3010]|uniref:YkgJ family cysteine cluster protein n=1 Tax=Butyrivibrio sp. LC3010 TaxID=1280680 RepID=UPI00041839D7|nr:YkgJ family cysteine cluster protein [Butyrivibrio sp. LC3010]